MSSAGTGWIKKLKLSSNGPGFQLYMILHHKQPATSPITSLVFQSLSHSLTLLVRKSFYRNITLVFVFMCVCLRGVCEDKRDWSLTDRHHVCVYVVVCLNVSVSEPILKQKPWGDNILTRAKKGFSLLWSFYLCSSHMDIETHSFLVT